MISAQAVGIAVAAAFITGAAIGGSVAYAWRGEAVAELKAEQVVADRQAGVIGKALETETEAAQEVADRAIETVTQAADGPPQPIIVERIVRLPAAHCLRSAEATEGRRAAESRDKPQAAGQADSAAGADDARYIRIRADEYVRITRALYDKILEYREQHRNHIGLSRIVPRLSCVKLVD